nr:PE-PPE domain-containing protein [Mycolicibacterium komanii]
MRKCIRVLYLSLLGLLSAAVLSAATAFVAAISLAASTALIVPGTGTPNANDVDDYMPNFRDYYMKTTQCTTGNSCDLDGIDYFASFWPITLPGWCDPGRCEKFDVSVADGVTHLNDALTSLKNLGYNGDLVIAGYSQGARVATISKMQFANGDWKGLVDQITAAGGKVEFVYIGNPNRPNGGLLSRLGILGHIPILDVTTGQPTPTNTPFKTKDWAIRWEGIADFSQYLLNPLSVVNSILGFYYDHGTYLAINEDSDPGETPAGYTVAEWKELTTYPEKHPDLVQIETYGDTTYYTIRPKVLPLVRPLHSIPLIGKPIADFWEPILEVIIEETGYNRNIPFGQYSPFGLIPIFNPITLVLKLIPAVFQGAINFLGNFIPALAPKPIEITPEPVTPVAPPGQGGEQDDPPENEIDNLNADDIEGDNLRQMAARGDGEAMVLALNSEGELTATEGAEGGIADPAEGDVIADSAEGDVVTDPAEGGVITDPTDGQIIENPDPQETVIDLNPSGVVGEKTTDPADGDVVTSVKGPEVKKDPDVTKKPDLKSNVAQNRLDANGRSVSLNASPNQAGEPSKDAGKGNVQRIAPAGPEEGLTTKPDPTGNAKDPKDANDAQDANDSAPAAA